MKKLIADLKEYENNARTHSENQLEKIKNSIKEFGFINPVIVDENNMILVGHGRVQAAKELGMMEVPCRVITNLTEDQKKAYILADNKLSDLSGWDHELLNTEIESLDIDMSLFGYELLDTTSYNKDEEQGEIDGGGELNLDEYDDEQFDHECPSCGFQFNNKVVK